MKNKQMLLTANKEAVIELIRTKGPINRAMIARLTGLSIPTIMKITDDFIQAGLVRSIGKGESTGGKKPDMLEFIEDAYYIIGVDLGRHRKNVILMDMAGRIIKRNQEIVSEDEIQNPQVYIECIAKMISACIKYAEEIGKPILGIGVGIAGIVDEQKQVNVFSADFGWNNVKVVQQLKEYFDLPIAMENSNRTMELGEKWFGAGKDCNYIFCVNWGYGIGAAILEEGSLLQGYNGSSGEFGHLTLEKDGPLCDCGNRGCLEALSSGNAIAKQMRKILRQRNCMAEADMENVQADDVFTFMKQGDKAAEKIIWEAVEYMGIGIAGSINLLDPNMIVLSGGITKSKEIYHSYLMETIEKHRMRNAGTKVKVCYGHLGENASAIGAATLILKNLIEKGGN